MEITEFKVSLYYEPKKTIEIYIGKGVSGCNIIDITGHCPEYFFKDNNRLKVIRQPLLPERVVIARTIEEDVMTKGLVK